MTARKARRPPTESSTHRTLLAQLQTGLSDAELYEVLVTSLLAHDQDGRARLLNALNADTASVLQSILSPPRRGPVRTVAPGKRKLQQEWDALWAEWNDCVVESGLEDGKYVQQDHHWEAPYFAPVDLSDDLDAIAKRLRPLLPRMRNQRLVSDFSFIHQLVRLDEEIGSGLPEYVDSDWCELRLGAEATSCLLEWEAGGSGAASRDPFSLVDALCSLTTRLHHVYLDSTTVARFVKSFTEDALQAVLAGIERSRTDQHWAHVLEQPVSSWFRLVLELSRRRRPGLHTMLCSSNVKDDWTLAAPVVSDLMRRREYGSAESLLATAFRSMWRPPLENDWDPRSVLLALHVHLDRDPKRLRIAERLLRARRKVAVASGDMGNAAALDLQVVVLHDPEDGKAVVQAFREMNDPKLARVRKELLTEWCRLVANRALSSFGNSSGDVLGQWVAELVNTAIEGTGAVPALHRSVGRTLAHAEKALKQPTGGGYWRSPRTWHDERTLRALARLTLDLDVTGRLQQCGPTLHGILQRTIGTRSTKLDRTRQEWFAQAGGAQLLEDVLSFWRKHVAGLVPDPSQANYGTCVQWLVAARELARKQADSILAEWGTTHRLKRNLWKAVHEAGLRVPAGVRRS